MPAVPEDYSRTADTTQLLLDASAGDAAARNALWPHVYEALRDLARRRLLEFRSGDTLDTGALVHEAFLRLVDQTRIDLADRSHFFALASRAMRFVLIDYARQRSALKRGGPEADIRLDESVMAADTAAADRAVDLISLNSALDRLSATDSRLGDLVEFRFFGGLTYEEIADITGRSVPTVNRDWRRARSWLFQYMQDHPSVA